jgi:hypothetical protein
VSRPIKRQPALPPHLAEVLELQRLVGNAAVSSLLSRSASPDTRMTVQRGILDWLKGKKTSKKKKQRGASSKGPSKVEELTVVDHLGGDQVDLCIANTPFLESYIHSEVKAAGNVYVHNATEFVELASAYLKEAGDPEPERLARAINGWAADGEIHILESGGDQGTAIHEGIHLHQHPKFKETVGWSANEGATEYFARMVCEQNDIARAERFYKREFEAITTLAHLVSDATLANAFFKGELGALEMEVNTTKGDDHFKMWADSMKQKDFWAADAFLSL